jgi:hypothetical protein
LIDVKNEEITKSLKIEKPRFPRLFVVLCCGVFKLAGLQMKLPRTFHVEKLRLSASLDWGFTLKQASNATLK